MSAADRDPMDDGFAKVTTDDEELLEADDLSGEADLAGPDLPATELAGDDDYEVLDEVVAEDPKDL